VLSKIFSRAFDVELIDPIPADEYGSFAMTPEDALSDFQGKTRLFEKLEGQDTADRHDGD
jgi:hypothetical protein